MSRRTRELNAVVPAAVRNGAWRRETARWRKHKERAFECRLATPRKPHEGPCFAPVRDKTGHVVLVDGEPHMVQTATCKNYPFAVWQKEIQRMLAAGRTPEYIEKHAPKMGPWEWHPGRGLGTQEVDNLLALSLPIETPEVRKASLRHLFHKRGLGRFHPDDFANAHARIENAGRV